MNRDAYLKHAQLRLGEMFPSHRVDEPKGDYSGKRPGWYVRVHEVGSPDLSLTVEALDDGELRTALLCWSDGVQRLSLKKLEEDLMARPVDLPDGARDWYVLPGKGSGIRSLVLFWQKPALGNHGGEWPKAVEGIRWLFEVLYTREHDFDVRASPKWP